MRFGAVVVVVCVIGACGGTAASVGDSDGGAASSSSGGSSSGTSGTSSSSGDVTSDGGGSLTDAKAKDAAREANAPGCPGQWSDPPPQGHCTLGLECAYDEGTCKCLDYCGGAPPPPDEDFSHWGCKPYDDCPAAKPTAGSACKSPGKTCSYGDCCVELFTCINSKWSSGGVSCPP